MDRSVLVDVDFRKGEKVVEALEKSGLPLAVALWVHFPEYEDWRFVVASKKLDALNLGDAYLRVNRALDEGGITVWEAPHVRHEDHRPFCSSLKKGLRQSRKRRWNAARWADLG